MTAFKNKAQHAALTAAVENMTANATTTSEEQLRLFHLAGDFFGQTAREAKAIHDLLRDSEKKMLVKQQ